MPTLLTLNQAEYATNILLDSDKVPVLVGTSGIGKTEIVREIASRRGAFFKSITCSLLQEGDLMLPIPQLEGSSNKMNKFLDIFLLQNQGVVDTTKEIEEFLDMDTKVTSENAVVRAIDSDILEIIEYLRENPDGEAILFLDELNRASVAVQAELMNVILAKELKGTTIPDGCKIVVAMNPSRDMGVYSNSNYAVNSGDVAIKDRLAYLFLSPSVDEWVQWGSEYITGTSITRIDERVSSFLQEQPTPEAIFVGDETDSFITPTPRSWKDVSDIIRTFDNGDKKSKLILKAMIEGKVGDKNTLLLMSYLDNIETYFSLKDVLNNEAEFKEEELNRFKNSQEYRKVSVLRNVIQRMNNDLMLVETTNSSDESFEYLNNPNIIDKFISLVRVMGERASDNSLTVIRYAKNNKFFWEEACKKDAFLDLALENKFMLD